MKSALDLLIGGIKDASTIDYPGELVSVIFFCRCQFRCPFCQNRGLVLEKDCKNVSINEIINQLRQHQKYITGICVTGGEPTVQLEGLIELFTQTRKIKLLNKLDTNGFDSDALNRVLLLELVDYIAIDIKAPLIPEIYGKVIGNPSLGKKAVIQIHESLNILEKYSHLYEVRTTIVPKFNDTPELIEQIARSLSNYNAECYILQQFRASGGTLDKSFSSLPVMEHTRLVELAKIAKKYLPDVRIRTIEAGEEKI